MSLPSVGVIGIGAFGSKVALRLLWNGWSALQLYDVNDISTRQFTNDYGGQTAGSPRMIAQCCEIAVTALPSMAMMREVCFGWESLAKGWDKGGIVLNLGVHEPLAVATLARELAARNIDFIDAPAFGAPQDAREGKLRLLVGGSKAAFDRARPVLDVLATAVERVGEPGAPQALGAIADYMRGARLLAASEALRLGAAFGLSPERVVGIADAPGLGATLRDEVLSRRFETGRALGAVRENMDNAARLAGALDIPLPLLAATRELWRRADAEIGSGADHSAIVKWLERLRQPKEPEAPVA